VLKIIDLVKMAQQGIANEVEVATASFHLIIVDSELATGALGLVEVKLRFHFEDEVTDLDTNWFEFWGDFIARCHNLTEVVVVNTI